MDARHEYNPVRLPNWRAVRAIHLADHSPRPLHPAPYDDSYVRTYWRYLSELIAAGAESQRRISAWSEMPHVHQAHELYFKSGLETRQILEAWLLTREEFSYIADRVAIEAAALEHFEQLFFNVRDRLDCSTWIAKIIKGPQNFAAVNCHTKWELERGILYRMFAFSGGRVALDALTNGGELGERAKSIEDIVRLFNKALPSTVQRQATLAACDLPLDPSSVMRILSLAKRRPR
jgi:hypothetical protein